MAQFFSFPGGRALSPPPRTDIMQLEIENAMIQALTSPLAFEDGGRSPPHASTRRGAVDGFPEDDILPCIADVDAPLSIPCISTPAPAAVGFHVAAITQKVDCLHLDAGQGSSSQVGGPQQLFSPPRWPSSTLRLLVHAHQLPRKHGPLLLLLAEARVRPHPAAPCLWLSARRCASSKNSAALAQRIG